MARKGFRRGIAVIWMALVLILMVAIVGLSIDTGKFAWNVHQMHLAADAGSLAGAHVVKYFPPNLVVQRAHDITFQNTADQRPVNPATTLQSDPLSGNEEIILGRWVRQQRKFYPTLIGANAVKVIARRAAALAPRAPALSLLFAPAFGVGSLDADRYATALSQVSTGAALICLAPDPSIYRPYGWRDGDTGWRISGDTIIDLGGGRHFRTAQPMIGDAQINATSTDSPKPAMSVDGKSVEITAVDLNVVGGTNPEPGNSAWDSLYPESEIPFSLNPEAGSMLDPLADAVAPDLSGMAVPIAGKIDNAMVAAAGGQMTLSPGYYPAGVELTSGGTLVLPGGPDAVYAFGGAGLVVNGGSIVGNGVMLYITGDPDGSKTGTATPYGEIRLRGDPLIELVSRGDAGYLDTVCGEAGVVLWQDRDNPNMATILGTPGALLKGTIYCGYNPVEIGGDAQQTGTQLIAACLRNHGNLTLRIPYDGRNAVEAQFSALVE